MPDPPVLLHSARLANDIERERQEPEIEHLLGLAALPPVGISEMVQPVCVENYISVKIRRADRRIAREQFLRAAPQAAVVISKHKVARL